MADGSSIWKKEFHLRRQRPSAAPEGGERTASTSIWKRDVRLFPLRFAEVESGSRSEIEPPAVRSPLAPAPRIEPARGAVDEQFLVTPGAGDAVDDPWFDSGHEDADGAFPAGVSGAGSPAPGRSAGAEKLSEWLAAAAVEPVVPSPPVWRPEPAGSQHGADISEPDGGTAAEHKDSPLPDEAAPLSYPEDEPTPVRAPWLALPAAEVSAGWPATAPLDLPAPGRNTSEAEADGLKAETDESASMFAFRSEEPSPEQPSEAPWWAAGHAPLEEDTAGWTDASTDPKAQPDESISMFAVHSEESSPEQPSGAPWRADDHAPLEDDTAGWTGGSTVELPEHPWTPLTAYSDEPEPAAAAEDGRGAHEPVSAREWVAREREEPPAAEPEQVSSPWDSPEPAPVAREWPAIAPVARLDERWAQAPSGGTSSEPEPSEPHEHAESPWSSAGAKAEQPAPAAQPDANAWFSHTPEEREAEQVDEPPAEPGYPATSPWSPVAEAFETESQEPSFSSSTPEPAATSPSSPWLSDVSAPPEDPPSPWSAAPREPLPEPGWRDTGSPAAEDGDWPPAVTQTPDETPASFWSSSPSREAEREAFSAAEIEADGASPWSGAGSEVPLEADEPPSSTWSYPEDGEELDSPTELPAGEDLLSPLFEAPGYQPSALDAPDAVPGSPWSVVPATDDAWVAANDGPDAAEDRSSWEADPASDEPATEVAHEEPATIAAFVAETATSAIDGDDASTGLDPTSTGEPLGPTGSELVEAPRRPAKTAPAVGPKPPVWRRELKLPRMKRQSSGPAAGRELVGLRIGSTGLGAALVHNGSGSPELLQLAHAPLNRGVVVAGEVREPDALAAALRDFFAANKLPRRSVRLGIASNRIGVRVIDVPAIDDPKLLENAIRFRAQELLSIPINEAVLDHVVLGESVGAEGPTRRVLVAFAHRELIDRYVEACKKARIRLVGVDFDAFALLRAVAEPADTSQPAEQATVAVSIGHERTIFAVAEGSVCDFTRVLEWGGGSLDVGLARTLNLAPSEAGSIKHGLSLSGEEQADGLSPAQAEAARVAMRTELQVLARELLASLQFYQSRPGSLAIGEILLTGGGAQLAGTGEELERRLGVPVRIANPFRRITLGKRVTPPALPGSLSIAIGLGIEGA